MKEKQEVIDETLIEDLEPSETFAGLVARVGNQAGVGNLSLGAIRMVVRERAASPEASETDATAEIPADLGA